MPRIAPATPDQIDQKATQTLDQVEKATGKRPNIMRTMAHSSAVLQAYVGFQQALGRASLDPALREQIALAVAGANGCDYCASAHTAMAQAQGVDDAETRENLDGRSTDPATEAALAFARTVVNKRGWVDDDDLAAVREAGFGDQKIVELLAVVAINMFTNYFNHATRPEVDFPPVELPASTGD